MRQAVAQPQGIHTPFVVTASHNGVLQAVYRYQLLTSVQVVRACGYSPNSLARVQRLTKQLVDNEYLLALARPVVRGKAPLVYTLARKGLNYLKGAGFDVREYFRPSQEQEKSYLFLLHTLAINDVLIAAANLHKVAADYSLASFIHERVLKRTPYKIKLWFGEREEITTVIPDAFLLFVEHKQNGREKHIPILLELDRNTTEQRHFRHNLRARIAFIQQEGYKTLLETATVTFAYANSEGGMKRREELRSWARKELAATSEQRWLSNLFLFSALPDDLEPKQLFLAPCWYVPFEDDKPIALLAQ
jgi:hypothetical protein